MEINGNIPVRLGERYDAKGERCKIGRVMELDEEKSRIR